METLQTRISNSLANGFRLDEGMETILTTEKRQPGTISKLPASERLRLGHYQDERKAYLAANGGKLPERKQETD
jgi:hypothetical protein